MIESNKPFYSSTESMLRVGVFAAHAVSSVIMLLKAYGTFDDSGCKALAFPTTRMVTMNDPFVRELNPVLYPLPMARLNNLTNCSDDTSWNQGWCKSKNLVDLYDYESDLNSFVFGSSWNIIFAVVVFEWITASYALFYFDPFDSWFSGCDALWYGLHPIPVITTLWNFFLVLFMWCNREKMNIPFNNAFLYTMALAATIVVQNVLAINRSWRIDVEKEDNTQIEYGQHTSSVALQLRTDSFLRSRRKGEYKPLTPVSKNTTYDFHEAFYMQLFDRCCCSPIPRYIEYFITAPILLAALYASSVPGELTWKFQFIVLALMACNALGVPLHHSVIRIGSDLERFTKSATYFLIASWLCLLAGLYIFVWTLRDFLIGGDSGMPQWIQVLVWMMVVLYAMFGVAASRYYLPPILWDVQYKAEDYRWLGFYFDVFSLAIKLPVAWTIWTKGAILMCEKAVTC